MSRFLLRVFMGVLLAHTLTAKDRKIWVVTLKDGASYAAYEYRDVGKDQVSIKYVPAHGTGFITIKRPKASVASVEEVTVEEPDHDVVNLDEPKKAEKPEEPAPTEITLLDLRTNLRANIDTNLVTKEASMMLSTYYNYGYRNAESTHVCFEINDGTSRAYFYGTRDWEGTEKLRQALLNRKVIVGVFRFTVRSDRFEKEASDIHAELGGYKVPEFYFAEEP